MKMTKEIAMNAPDSPGGTPPVPPPSASARRRVWLEVPYPENAVAKAAGARWDGKARRWYARRDDGGAGTVGSASTGS